MSKSIEQSVMSGSVTSIASSETSSNKSDEVLTTSTNGDLTRRYTFIKVKWRFLIIFCNNPCQNFDLDIRTFIEN
jgi:hypothetical protein